MAKFKKNIKGNFDEVMLKIYAATKSLGSSVVLVDESFYVSENIKVTLQVYEKYYFRMNGYASLSIMAVADGDDITITAISAAAGGGFFNIDFGVCYSLIDSFERTFNETVL